MEVELGIGQGIIIGVRSIGSVGVAIRLPRVVIMAKAKFQLGDSVVINKRTPLYLRDYLRRNRKRTITSIFYDERLQCRRYYLGTNNRGKVESNLAIYPFRSYMLSKPLNQMKAGRPRERRKYHRSILGYHTSILTKASKDSVISSALCVC